MSKLSITCGRYKKRNRYVLDKHRICLQMIQIMCQPEKNFVFKLSLYLHYTGRFKNKNYFGYKGHLLMVSSPFKIFRRTKEYLYPKKGKTYLGIYLS